MKQTFFEIKSQENIAKDIYKAVLIGDTSDITSPGQFVNIKVDSCFLRRPISVCDVNKNELTIIYKVVGKGWVFVLLILVVGSQGLGIG